MNFDAPANARMAPPVPALQPPRGPFQPLPPDSQARVSKRVLGLAFGPYYFGRGQEVPLDLLRQEGPHLYGTGPVTVLWPYGRHETRTGARVPVGAFVDVEGQRYEKNPAPEGKETLRAEQGWFVDTVAFSQAGPLVKAHHYTHSHANAAVAIHGLYHPSGQLVGVAWWMPPVPGAAKSAAKLSSQIVDRIQQEKNLRRPEGQRMPVLELPISPHQVLHLSRLVLVPGLPQNAATFLLGQSLSRLNRMRYPVLLTFADTGEEHTGAIYKATNRIDLGPVPTDKQSSWVHTVTGERRGQKRADKNLSAEQMRALGFVPVPAADKIKFLMIDERALFRLFDEHIRARTGKPRPPRPLPAAVGV